MTQWAVVTGAGNGIGSVIARHAVKAGYRVAAWDVEETGLAALTRELGDAFVGSVVDVTDEAAVRAAVDALPEAPALVVNNAGVVRFGPLLQLSVEDSAVRGRREPHRHSRGPHRGGADDRDRRGSIVNIASINGLAADPNAGALHGLQGGGDHVDRAHGAGVGHRGRAGNAVAPGLINAGMSEAINADPEARRLRQGRVPLGRLGTADDVAETVLFLGSDKAAYVTGQTLAVDGGITVSALHNLPRPASVDTAGVVDACRPVPDWPRGS